ncbi:MAG TPA: zf-HC2 domain-containing protein [Anaeromyxobacteraceae bacterium]|nr:zf-HC2 domain-containing protein [Anaeromyxobacteraceae bacterium]
MKHLADELTAFLDGALAPDERARVEAHLGACAACRAERERLEKAVALLGRLPEAPAPSPTFEARFQARLAAQRALPRRPRLLDLLAWRHLAPGLAGAALAASVLVYAGARHRADERSMAEHLDLLESYEAVASVGVVERADDVQVVAHLDELGEGRP